MRLEREEYTTALSKREITGLALGGFLGALVGVATAWILLTRPEEMPGRRGRGKGISALEILKTILAFLRIVSKLAEWQ